MIAKKKKKMTGIFIFIQFSCILSFYILNFITCMMAFRLKMEFNKFLDCHWNAYVAIILRIIRHKLDSSWKWQKRKQERKSHTDKRAVIKKIELKKPQKRTKHIFNINVTSMAICVHSNWPWKWKIDKMTRKKKAFNLLFQLNAFQCIFRSI